MNTLEVQVSVLWESYWRSFNDAEQQSRDQGKSQLEAQNLRRQFAKRALGDFSQLEREILHRIVDSTTLLLYRLGFMLYGDAGDDRSALKYLRLILRCTSIERDLVDEQIIAIEMTLRVYEQNQEELAHTLSLINIRDIGILEQKRLRQAVFTAITSRHIRADEPIKDVLYAELFRVCGLAVDNDEKRTFGDFFNAYKIAPLEITSID